MACTIWYILREASSHLLHPSIYPFYGLNILYGVTQSLNLESQFGTASTVILKAAPIWYLVIYSNFIDAGQGRRNRMRFVTENQSQQNGNSREIDNERRTDQSQVSSGQQQSFGTGYESLLSTVSRTIQDNDIQYKRYFIYGLLCSSIGDAFLVFSSTFLHGVFMFGVAHVLYILGLRKRYSHSNSKTFYAWFVFPAGLIMCPYILSGIDSRTLGAAVLAYNVTINTMLYQAASAVENDVCNSSAFLAMLGATSFVLSDSMLALHAWKITLPYPNLLVMSTYYFAQVCLALSIY